MAKTFKDRIKKTKDRQYYSRKNKRQFKSVIKSHKWQSLEDFYIEENLDILEDSDHFGEYSEK